MNDFRFLRALSTRWMWVGLLLVALCTAVRAQQTVLEVIPLGYRTAEQVIPVLKPLLDKQGSISGMQNQLIIRTTPANLAEGNSAFIRIGQSVPVPQRQIVRTIVNGQIIERYVEAVEYRDVMTGFYALPRVTGDRVTLDISPQRDTLGTSAQPPGSIDVTKTLTRPCSILTS